MGLVLFEKEGVVFKNEDVRNVPLHGITKTSHVGIDDGFIAVSLDVPIEKHHPAEFRPGANSRFASSNRSVRSRRLIHMINGKKSQISGVKRMFKF